MKLLHQNRELEWRLSVEPEPLILMQGVSGVYAFRVLMSLTVRLPTLYIVARWEMVATRCMT